jgi:hypothetical protein
MVLLALISTTTQLDCVRSRGIRLESDNLDWVNDDHWTLEQWFCSNNNHKAAVVAIPGKGGNIERSKAETSF